MISKILQFVGANRLEDQIIHFKDLMNHFDIYVHDEAINPEIAINAILSAREQHTSTILPKLSTIFNLVPFSPTNHGTAA